MRQKSLPLWQIECDFLHEVFHHTMANEMKIIAAKKKKTHYLRIHWKCVTVLKKNSNGSLDEVLLKCYILSKRFLPSPNIFWTREHDCIWKLSNGNGSRCFYTGVCCIWNSLGPDQTEIGYAQELFSCIVPHPEFFAGRSSKSSWALQILRSVRAVSGHTLPVREADKQHLWETPSDIRSRIWCRHPIDFSIL